MRNAKDFAVFGLLLATGLVVSTAIAIDGIRDIRMSHQIIKVRGYAELPVESDLAVWSVTVYARDANLAGAYGTLDAHREKARGLLRESGVEDGEIRIPPVRVTEMRKRTEEGNPTNEIEAYVLSQRIEVTSRDVRKVAGISGTVTRLLGEGIELHAGSPQYYYTGVNDLKSRLLVAATKDARMRAKTLAEGSGVELGALRAARQGAFSVLPADAGSISEDTCDDTSSIAKKLTAVVTVDYAMR
jgi:hypothetical protein